MSERDFHEKDKIWTFKTRIYRSPLAQYYEDEFLVEPDPYPESVLQGLSGHGFNGIWMRGRLRDLATNTAFPEFGKGSEQRLKRLNDLIRRAGEYNIRVYIYLTEPLGLNEKDPFFERHPNVRGMRYCISEQWGGSNLWGGAKSALCSSTPEVQQYLKQSTANLFQNASGLGGLILITASEHHHHCYSHVDFTGMQQGDPQFSRIQECPRCAGRTAAEVVSEIINTIYRSAVKVSPSAEIIAWNWAWSQYEIEPQTNLIFSLDPGVIWMGGFEAGARLSIEGKETVNEEYSLSYAGPSERFREAARAARESGHRVFAKIQVGTTHEDACIPYLPVMNKVIDKMRMMAATKVDGYMGCWNFGNFLSPVTELACRMSGYPQPDGEALLCEIAERDYGTEAALYVLQAWKDFSRATDHYPLCMFLLGQGIHTRGPVYPFHFQPVFKPTPINWREVPYEDWGDDHSTWTSKLGLDIIRKAYARLLDGWEQGLEQLQGASFHTAGECRERLQKHAGVAHFFYHQIRSSLNFLNFIEARDAMYVEPNRDKALGYLSKLEGIIRNELEHCSQVKPLLENDSTLGWHGEAYAYLIDVAGIDRKLEQLRKMLGEDIPAYRKKRLNNMKM